MEIYQQLNRSVPTTHEVKALKVWSLDAELVLFQPVEPSLVLLMVLFCPLTEFIGTGALKEPIVVRIEVPCRDDSLLPNALIHLMAASSGPTSTVDSSESGLAFQSRGESDFFPRGRLP